MIQNKSIVKTIKITKGIIYVLRNGWAIESWNHTNFICLSENTLFGNIQSYPHYYTSGNHPLRKYAFDKNYDISTKKLIKLVAKFAPYNREVTCKQSVRIMGGKIIHI